MNKSVVALSLLCGFVGGLVSSQLNNPRAALAAHDYDPESTKLIDSIQTRRLLLVDENLRTVMALESGSGLPTLTIQSPDSPERITIRPTGITAQAEVSPDGKKAVLSEAVFAATGTHKQPMHRGCSCLLRTGR